jgi:hypothetical protein
MAKNNPKNKQNKNKLEQKGNNKIIPKYKQNHNKTNTHSNTHLSTINKIIQTKG